MSHTCGGSKQVEAADQSHRQPCGQVWGRYSCLFRHLITHAVDILGITHVWTEHTHTHTHARTHTDTDTDTDTHTHTHTYTHTHTHTQTNKQTNKQTYIWRSAQHTTWYHNWINHQSYLNDNQCVDKACNSCLANCEQKVTQYVVPFCDMSVR